MVLPRNVDRRSLFLTEPFWKLPSVRAQSAGTPPSTFLFLPIHLSNSPRSGDPAPPVNRRVVEASRLPMVIGSLFNTGSVMSFEGASSRRKAVDAPYGRYIGRCCRPCQHLMKEKCTSALRANTGFLLRPPSRYGVDCGTSQGQTPYCGHIRRPFFTLSVGVVSSGVVTSAS